MFSLNRIDASVHQERRSIQSLAQFSVPCEFEPRPLTERMQQREDGKFKILSIDGGGVRGIIPLKILTSLERYIGPISDTFDLIAGTSTGGIIALSLTASLDRLRADDILRLYQTRSNEIFLTDHYQGTRNAAAYALSHLPLGQETIVKKLIGNPIYTDAGVKRIASELFGGTPIKDTRTNVLIPAVDITNINRARTHFFSNRDRETAFWAVQDIACATSAAPTYFPYKKIHQRTYIDGGLACNNPAAEAFWYGARNGIPNERQHVLSLGTGFADIEGINPESGQHNALYWAKRVYPTIDAALSYTVDQNLQSTLGNRYWRLNPRLEREINLDDFSPETINQLNEIGDTLVEEEADGIREIARVLQTNVF